MMLVNTDLLTVFEILRSYKVKQVITCRAWCDNLNIYHAPSHVFFQMGAVSFIETMDHTSLSNITQEEFEK